MPSQTELLFDLGLGQRIAGVTRFCVHPPEARSLAVVVGGTKDPDLEKIDAIQPDLIIANKEENLRACIEKLQEKYPVWISDVSTLEDANQMIVTIGHMTGTAHVARELSNTIRSGFVGIRKNPPKRALYLIWRKPWMAAAGGTFIDCMLKEVGLTNVLAQKDRYPQLTSEELMALDPEIVLLSSEPYPFKEKHFVEIQTILPASKILLVDGEMFSWYGSRLRFAPDYFNSLGLDQL